MLKELFEKKLRDRNLSVRSAAAEMNVSHTTLHRVLNDEPVDLKTVIALCNWLNVSPSTILDTEAKDTRTSIPAVIASLIEQDERLASIFTDMAEDLQSGKVSPDDVEDIVSYAAYRLRKKNDKHQSSGIHGTD
jgi:DNA-binding Xre family transcriptional regulator